MPGIEISVTQHGLRRLCCVCVELSWIVAETNGNLKARIIITHKNLVSLNEFDRDENAARGEHLIRGRLSSQPTSHPHCLLRMEMAMEVRWR